MMLKTIMNKGLRWCIPVAVTGLFLILLFRKSGTPLFFSYYSARQLVLMAGMGIWSFICWRVALNTECYHRLTSRVFRVSSLRSIVLIGIAFLFLDIVYFFEGKNFFSDILYFLLPVASILPFGAALGTWLLADSHHQKTMTNLTLLCCFTLIGIIGLEGIFRGVLLRNLVPENEQGFMREIASHWPRSIQSLKPQNTFRIMGLSDSFGVAGGKKNYHYLLESMLQHDKLPIEVVNMSRGQYEPPDQFAVFNKFGPQYAPDLLMHGMFVGNDLVSDEFIRTKGPLLSYHKISVRKRKGWRSYRPGNFLLFQWLEHYLAVFRDRQLRRLNSPAQGDSATFSQETFLEIERRRLEICHKALDASATRWQDLTRVLDSLRQEVENRGATYIMVIHPDQFQVEEKLLQQIQEKYHLQLEEYDFELPQKFLAEFCRGRGIPCLDLLPVFQEKGREGGLYLSRDTHYNEAGNRLAAETIYQFLYEHRLLPQN